jgi:hypothetical protein
MSTVDEIKNAGKVLRDQLQALVTVQIVGHPDDVAFERLAPCYRVTVSAIDPESGKPEETIWKDISPKSSGNECLFVVKAEKLAGFFSRVIARKKPTPLQVQITAEPLAAWRNKYITIHQTESVAAGSQPVLKLVAMPHNTSITREQGHKALGL